jgi:FKBP-type peptidyl-prolyl cis-trans isomerase SlyD
VTNPLKPASIHDDVVVTLDYTLTVEGEIVETSQGSDPIQFIQGQGELIKGLESKLYGLTIGDARHVVVAPEDGYGLVEPEAGVEVERGEFPPNFPLEVGLELQLRTREGEVVEARIASIDSDSVQLDFNHPLAGKVLHFDVQVIDLRHPTDEELEHGHVHPDGSEDDETDEFDGEE